MSKRAGVQVVYGQIVGEDENNVGGFGSCFWFSACCPSAEGKQAGEGAGHGHPEERIHGYKEYSLGLIHYLHVRHRRTVHRGAPFGHPLALPRGGSCKLLRVARPSGSVFHPG